MNKSILGLLVALALIVPSTSFADSYQHFRNDTPFDVKMNPHETLFINNNAGKVNQLTVLFPNGTAIVTDSNVGNNGATSIKLDDVGQYTLYGVDGVIGYAIIAEPQVPVDQVGAQPVVLPQQNTTSTQNQTQTNSTVETNTSSGISLNTVQPTTNSTNVLNSTSVQNDTTIIERLDRLEQTNQDLVVKNQALSDKIDALQTQQLGMFGLLTKIAHSLGIT